MKKLSLFIFIIFSLSLTAQTSDLWKDVSKETIEGVVMSVHDADGFRVKRNGLYIPIRLIGCDAPEVQSNLITANQDYGVEAGAKLRNNVKGKTLALQLRGKDKYGRTLANAALPDGSDLTLYLIENGMAWYVNSKYLTKRQKAAYQNAMEYAKFEGLGLWALPNPILPSTFRKTHIIKRKKFLGVF